MQFAELGRGLCGVGAGLDLGGRGPDGRLGFFDQGGQFGAGPRGFLVRGVQGGGLGGRGGCELGEFFARGHEVTLGGGEIVSELGCRGGVGLEPGICGREFVEARAGLRQGGLGRGPGPPFLFQTGVCGGQLVALGVCGIKCGLGCLQLGPQRFQLIGDLASNGFACGEFLPGIDETLPGGGEIPVKRGDLGLGGAGRLGGGGQLGCEGGFFGGELGAGRLGGLDLGAKRRDLVCLSLDRRGGRGIFFRQVGARGLGCGQLRFQRRQLRLQVAEPGRGLGLGFGRGVRFRGGRGKFLGEGGNFLHLGFSGGGRLGPGGLGAGLLRGEPGRLGRSGGLDALGFLAGGLELSRKFLEAVRGRGLFGSRSDAGGLERLDPGLERSGLGGGFLGGKFSAPEGFIGSGATRVAGGFGGGSRLGELPGERVLLRGQPDHSAVGGGLFRRERGPCRLSRGQLGLEGGDLRLGFAELGGGLGGIRLGLRIGAGDGGGRAEFPGEARDFLRLGFGGGGRLGAGGLGGVPFGREPGFFRGHGGEGGRDPRLLGGVGSGEGLGPVGILESGRKVGGEFFDAIGGLRLCGGDGSARRLEGLDLRLEGRHLGGGLPGGGARVLRGFIRRGEGTLAGGEFLPRLGKGLPGRREFGVECVALGGVRSLGRGPGLGELGGEAGVFRGEFAEGVGGGRFFGGEGGPRRFGGSQLDLERGDL